MTVYSQHLPDQEPQANFEKVLRKLIFYHYYLYITNI